MMTIISHRGNLDGPNIAYENKPAYIENAIYEGFHVEVDLRTHNGKLFLGHDEVQYGVAIGWLFKHSSHLWIHCKDVKSLETCLKTDKLRCFFHENERHTIISNKLIWTHDIKEALPTSIIPLIDEKLAGNVFFEKYSHVHGICTDYANYYNSLMNTRKD